MDKGYFSYQAFTLWSEKCKYIIQKPIWVQEKTISSQLIEYKRYDYVDYFS